MATGLDAVREALRAAAQASGVSDPGAIARSVAVTLLLAAGGGLWWRARTRKVREKETIVVHRTRVRGAGAHRLVDDPQHAMYELDYAGHEWAEFLQVNLDQRDQHEAQREDVRYVSLLDYFNSLRAPGGINLRRISVTWAGRLGMDVLLPALGMVPALSTKKETKLDPVIVDVVRRGMRHIISPVTLAAISMTMHLTAKEIGQGKRFDPVAALAFGEVDERWREFFVDLPNPFDMNRDIPPLVARVRQRMEALDAEAKVGERSEPVDDQFMPGLRWGSPGLEFRESLDERASSLVLSVLFNRLSANLCSLLDGPSPGSRFTVRVTLGGQVSEHDSTDGLLEALGDDPEHTVRVGIRSLVTSFSRSMHVDDVDGKQYHVPLAIPMRTGLTDPDGASIVVPMSHAGVPVTIEGPTLRGRASVEHYLDVGSFTGWHPNVWRDWPWQAGCERWHNEYAEEWTWAMQVELVRCASVLAVLSCVTARESSMALGGYGFFGICLDSVAILQYAVMRETTIFPLLLSGEARSELLRVAQRMLGACLPGCALRDSITNVRRAIVNLHTDIDIPPRDMPGACDRVVQTLPPGSLFDLAHRARAQALALKDHMRCTFEVGDDGAIKQPKAPRTSKDPPPS